MFLKSVELYGFKSFADRTKFEFADGITSLLGPNGSGKSNVVDSIKWVLGTQALSQIRAGKREDVIFNGTDNRKPMPMCEVILTLNNEEGLLNIPVNEVEIKRRMFRNGETEYFINRERVLLKTIKEIFMDTGVGKSAYSILEQGRIDQILSLKPEDRRYIFEEAAGISRYKQQSEEASKKLDKTDENLSQVEIILKEQEKIYNSRKSQLEKVYKSRELMAKQESLEVDLQLASVQTFTKLLNFREEELNKLLEEQSSIDSLLDSQRDSLGKYQQELEDLRLKRESISANIYRAEEQISALGREFDIYNERYHEVHQRTKDAKFKAQQFSDKLERDRRNIEEKEQVYTALKDNISIAKDSIDKAQIEISQLISTREKYGLEINDITNETDSLAEKRISITNEISELANSITNRLEENIKGSGYSTVLRNKAEKALFEQIKKTQTILEERLNFLREISSVDFEKDVFSKAIEEADESLRIEIDEIKGLFQEYSGTIPTFLDEFTSPKGTLARKTELDSDLQKTYSQEADNKAKINQLTQEIERLSKLLILKESDLNDLRVEHARFLTNADSLALQISELKDGLKQSEFDFSDANHSIEAEQSKEAETLVQIDDVKERQNSLRQQIEQYREEVSNIVAQMEAKSSEISSQNSLFQGKFERKQTLIEDIATCRANIVSTNELIQKCFNDFFDSTGKSLKEFNDHEITRSDADLKTELDDVKKKIQDLGYINYMAEDEYNEAKKNYDFYTKNVEDLRKAKADLEEVIGEIRTKSEELFIETFDQINTSFQEMFTTLFGGGKAKLSLADEDNILSSGIEIQAQPPGKKMTYLPSLSGGEKSMTAVALLFATYKVKPSPFCILDEIDAALDAKNIGSFMKVLEKFDSKSQFIIITHNKNTVLGSDTLLGVTQEEPGVSKMIGYKLNNDRDTEGYEDTLKG